MFIIWELLSHNHSGFIYRARVFGGWLVKITEDALVEIQTDCMPQSGYEWRSSITFVPDPDHLWNDSHN